MPEDQIIIHIDRRGTGLQIHWGDNLSDEDREMFVNTVVMAARRRSPVLIIVRDKVLSSVDADQ